MINDYGTVCCPMCQKPAKTISEGWCFHCGYTSLGCKFNIEKTENGFKKDMVRINNL